MLAVNPLASIDSRFSPQSPDNAIPKESGCSAIPRRDIDDRSAWSPGYSDAEPSTLLHHRKKPVSRSRRLHRVAAVDPLFLFACYVEWERHENPSAGWELLSAAQSSHSDTRAHGRALLAHSRQLGGAGSSSESPEATRPQSSSEEDEMKTPYDLEITDHCCECNSSGVGFFCDFSEGPLCSLNEISHRSTLPAGAILCVEGQSPRGMFIVCSGRVNLSTTSREGKLLILKTAEAGEAVGLSAAISGMGYETTAETATPCQLNFIERKHLLELMHMYTEVGMQAAHCLSRDYHAAYRDIHDLILTRSSTGKLARLLLSQSPDQDSETSEFRIPGAMTHEEMGQRIGASRETVTRLLSELKRRQLIRSDGATLVIRDRVGLEALAV